MRETPPRHTRAMLHRKQPSLRFYPLLISKPIGIGMVPIPSIEKVLRIPKARPSMSSGTILVMVLLTTITKVPIVSPKQIMQKQLSKKANVVGQLGKNSRRKKMTGQQKLVKRRNLLSRLNFYIIFPKIGLDMTAIRVGRKMMAPACAKLILQRAMKKSLPLSQKGVQLIQVIAKITQSSQKVFENLKPDSFFSDQISFFPILNRRQ